MNIAKVMNKEKWNHFVKTLKYSLHCIVSPFDGFWDLTHEKRGSVGAATFIILMAVLTNVWSLRYTSFIIQPVLWEKVNIFMTIAEILIPLVIYCIANWSLTTLFEGKGNLRSIYMSLGYVLTPYVLIQLPMILVSNFITVEEKAFYQYFGSFSIVWCAWLLIASVMMIHDFSLSKAVVSLVGTLVGMLVIVFILILFFSLISDSIAYFISIYKELSYRFY